MKRLFSSPLLAVLPLVLLAVALAGVAGLLAVLPLVLLALMLQTVSASKDRPATARNARNLPHWLVVATYRAECLAYDVRRKLGGFLMAAMFRSGMALAVFPGTVTTDLGFGIVGEWAFDGPQRAQPARINHATAADIVIGRWFTLAADGSARPGGAGAIGGVLINPKNYTTAGGAGGTLSPSMTLLTGTLAELGYFGAVIVSVTGAVAIGQSAWYDTTTGVIGAGAPGAGQAAIPASKFIRVANAATGLCVLELTN